MKKLWQNYTVKRKCRNCKKQFQAFKYNVLKGFGKYCSRVCRNIGAKLGYKNGHPTYISKETYKKIGLGMRGENHWAWIANDPSYHTLHRWVAQRKGRPKECKRCGLNDPARMYDWANVDHSYKRNLEDFIRLCRPCHRKYDYQMQNA